MEFYREIFPAGTLQKKGCQEHGRYNAIAVELLPKEDVQSGTNARRYIITDDLDGIKQLQQSNNFVIISPITYAGMSRQSVNARYINAIAIDLDGIEEPHYLLDLLHQIEQGYLPRPSHIVFSGSGLHLYYQLFQPLPCFNNVTKPLAELKKALTRKIWNKYTTALADKPQYESLFQGFRMAGGVTKDGQRTQVFKTGNKVSIDYLNSFVHPKSRVQELTYKSNLSLEEAAKRYPDWYQRRIINDEPRGSWTCKRDLYDWWRQRVIYEASEGHRYYSVMVLSIMAKKSGINRKELEKDAFSMVERLDLLTSNEDNHFTRSDVLAALEMYNDSYKTFPINSIVSLTNIPIEKNKRNYRKQQLHLKIARANKAILKEAGELKNDGRPSKESVVREWRRLNPTGTKTACINETGLGRATVYRHWEK